MADRHSKHMPIRTNTCQLCFAPWLHWIVNAEVYFILAVIKMIAESQMNSQTRFAILKRFPPHLGGMQKTYYNVIVNKIIINFVLIEPEPTNRKSEWKDLPNKKRDSKCVPYIIISKMDSGRTGYLILDDTRNVLIFVLDINNSVVAFTTFFVLKAWWSWSKLHQKHQMYLYYSKYICV